jgi:heme exporter protein A
MTDPLLADQPPLIEARGLAYAREDERIFGPVDFALGTGGVLLIEGDNGAGKTTLIRLLAGLQEPTEGELLWRGSAYAGAFAPGQVVLLGHQLGIKPDLSPLEHLRFRIALDGLRPGTSPHAALLSVGLEGFEDMPARTLSAGQRKRIALATLLLGTATAWLLDEPYANLDREGHTLVDRMLDAHCRRGGAVALTSHGMIEPAVARVTTLQLGRAA